MTFTASFPTPPAARIPRAAPSNAAESEAALVSAAAARYLAVAFALVFGLAGTVAVLPLV